MEVEVRDNLDGAIRFLKKALERDGIFRQLRMREQMPNRTDRKKAKMIIANRRRVKWEAKKARSRYV